MASRIDTIRLVPLTRYPLQYLWIVGHARLRMNIGASFSHRVMRKQRQSAPSLAGSRRSCRMASRTCSRSPPCLSNAMVQLYPGSDHLSDSLINIRTKYPLQYLWIVFAATGALG